MTSTVSSYVPVLVLADEPEAAAPLVDALTARAGWASAGPMDLPHRIARLLWGFEAGRGEAGVSSLVDRRRMMTELRRLVDALVVAAGGSGKTHVVDVCGDGEQIGPFLRSVWPDAVVVAVRSDETAGEGIGVAAASPDLVVSAAEIGAHAGEVAERVAAAAATGGPARSRSARVPVKRGVARFRPAKSPMRDRVVVVLGAARSGTTWMHHMLCANPAVAGTLTGETWLFADVAPVWDRAVRAAAGDGATLTAMRAFCDALLSAVRDGQAHASHVCEKTPTTVWWLPLVAQLYPDAYYVHVVRDGRDVALSLARTRVPGDDVSAEDLDSAAREWVAAVGAVEAAAPGLSRFREVRYEDLLADPLGVVGDLWAWIGVDSSAEATRELALRATERVTPLPASGSIGGGKWRTLPTDQRSALLTSTEVLLKDLGYQMDAS